MKIFKKIKKNRGFSLVELMVASSVFIVVMLITSGSVFTVFNSNQKSKNIRSALDNFNISMESMTRTIRFGKNYHCGTAIPLSDPRNCNGGDSPLTVLDASGDLVTYGRFVDANGVGRVYRIRNSEPRYYVTSSDVNIQSLYFVVNGTVPSIGGLGTCPVDNDCFQPRVIILIKGYVGEKITTRSSFAFQTTVSQRELDFR